MNTDPKRPRPRKSRARAPAADDVQMSDEVPIKIEKQPMKRSRPDTDFDVVIETESKKQRDAVDPKPYYVWNFAMPHPCVWSTSALVMATSSGGAKQFASMATGYQGDQEANIRKMGAEEFMRAEPSAHLLGAGTFVAGEHADAVADAHKSMQTLHIYRCTGIKVNPPIPGIGLAIATTEANARELMRMELAAICANRPTCGIDSDADFNVERVPLEAEGDFCILLDGKMA